MTRRLPFSSLFYTTSSAQETQPPSPAATTTPAWMWPSCKHPRTQSFRSPSAAAKTITSIFVDSAESSSFANSSARTTHHVDCASDSLSTESEASAAAAADNMADAIVRGLCSDRLLFEPRAPSSSILEKKPPSSLAARRGALTAGQAEEEVSPSTFGGGVSVSLESADPYRDFRASMEEMVAAAHGAGDWECLEKMLTWYLGANGKDTHPAIITAFVDLVVSMAADGGGACNSSRVSSFTLAESSSAGGHFSFGRR